MAFTGTMATFTVKVPIVKIRYFAVPFPAKYCNLQGLTPCLEVCYSSVP